MSSKSPTNKQETTTSTKSSISKTSSKGQLKDLAELKKGSSKRIIIVGGDGKVKKVLSSSSASSPAPSASQKSVTVQPRSIPSWKNSSSDLNKASSPRPRRMKPSTVAVTNNDIELTNTPTARSDPDIDPSDDSPSDLLSEMFSEADEITPHNSFKDLPLGLLPKKKSPTNRSNRRLSLLYKKNLKKKDDENLREDFMETPWLPPSIEKAYIYQREHIFRNGDTRLDSINIINAPDLSIGVNLYFQFAMTMSICLFVMSILSLPSLIFVYNGQGISVDNQDAFGLYRFTLGNLGYDKTASDYAKLAACTNLPPQYSNDTCIHFSGYEITLSEASYFLSFFEFLQCIVFLFAIIQLYVALANKSEKASHSGLSVTNFAVMVSHLPTEISEIELLNHFSRLYQLGKRDFKRRPAVLEAQPVKSNGNTGLDVYLNTWIAECIIHKGIGKYIASFKGKQDLMKGLYRCRARMKMYKADTPHANGPNPIKYKQAEKEMLKIAKKVDELTKKNILQSGLKVIVDRSEIAALEHGAYRASLYNSEKVSVEHKSNNRESIYYHVEAPATVAFIIFQYSESMARCLNDYNVFNNFPFSFFYPNKLKLRGHEIIVSKAPEPDQIIWENLDVPVTTKFYLRLRTAMITLLLIILAFIMILQASIYKQEFANSKPDLSLCQSYIPQLYVNDSSTVNYNDINILLPETSSQRASLNSQCNDMKSGTFYARWVYGSNASKPITDGYEVEACTSGLCPILGATTFCPCVSTTSGEKCSTAACFQSSSPSSSQDGKCESFNAGTIGACYCYNELLEGLKKGTFTSGGINSDCLLFYYQYSVSEGLTYGSVIATALINGITRKALKLLARYEAYTSLDEFQASIMTKIFFTNFLTMGILVLVAYGNANNHNSFLTSFHLFTGPYSDFTSDWYGNLGFYLISTFIIQSFAPLVMNLLRYFIIKPISRRYHFRRVEKRTSHSLVMQDDLNHLMVGNIFDATDHAAQLLTLVFFAMMYAPGLPLLMPLCSFAFLFYFRIDKFLLCRYYQKPLNIGDAVFRGILFYLPFAIVIRLGFAIWMFSYPDILHVTTNNGSTTTLAAIAKQEEASATGSSSINERIYQPHVYPLYICLILLLIGIFCKLFWKQLPIYWSLKILSRGYQRIFGKKKGLYVNEINFSSVNGEEEEDDLEMLPMTRDKGVITMWELVRSGDELRKHCAAFTEDYYHLIKHKDYIPNSCYDMLTYGYLEQLSELEIEEGFKIESIEDYVVHVKRWLKTIRRITGEIAQAGEKKKTYEVIADHRCYSYDIEKIDEYKFAMRGLREGIMSFIAFLDKNDMMMEDFEELMKSPNLLEPFDNERLEEQRKQLLLFLESSGFSSHIVKQYHQQKGGGKGKKKETHSGLLEGIRELSMKDRLIDVIEGILFDHSYLEPLVPTCLRRKESSYQELSETMDRSSNPSQSNRPTSASVNLRNNDEYSETQSFQNQINPQNSVKFHDHVDKIILEDPTDEGPNDTTQQENQSSTVEERKEEDGSKKRKKRRKRKKETNNQSPDPYQDYSYQQEFPYNNSADTGYPLPFDPSEPSYFDPILGGYVKPPTKPGEPMIVAVPVNPYAHPHAAINYQNDPSQQGYYDPNQHSSYSYDGNHPESFYGYASDESFYDGAFNGESYNYEYPQSSPFQSIEGDYATSRSSPDQMLYGSFFSQPSNMVSPSYEGWNNSFSPTPFREERTDDMEGGKGSKKKKKGKKGRKKRKMKEGGNGENTLAKEDKVESNPVVLVDDIVFRPNH